jgi:hypothetical protein
MKHDVSQYQLNLSRRAGRQLAMGGEQGNSISFASLHSLKCESLHSQKNPFFLTIMFTFMVHAIQSL